MTSKKTSRNKAKIIKAWKEGSIIEYRFSKDCSWIFAGDNPIFDHEGEFRVKPYECEKYMPGRKRDA